MAKHNCPDCGAAHDMDTAGRIARLEERVKELEATRRCTLPHYYYYPVTITSPTISPWTWHGTNTPNVGPVTVYNNHHDDLRPASGTFELT